uniref:Cleavage/polyadenylation specificity factor A subunit C-terminal domain-containing protein n=1 Tax=Theropithecus gelada TaxID=9565 RepID=A0A8D2F032_THEGE
MYAVYKQAHPPTGLEFAMYCNFFNNSERNLVVAGTSQLYVYRLNRDAEPGQHGETLSLLKIQKNNTQEAEAGESFEPERQRLQ